jgi:hypothetical protein
MIARKVIRQPLIPNILTFVYGLFIRKISSRITFSLSIYDSNERINVVQGESNLFIEVMDELGLIINKWFWMTFFRRLPAPRAACLQI